MNQQLRELADTTDDVFWVFSSDWEELRFVNAAYEAIFGQPVAEFEANPLSFLDQVHRDDVDRVIRATERASAGESLQIEYRVNKSEAFTLWVESRCKPVTDADGNVESIAGFTREITERKIREQSLVEKNEQLEQFASTVAHDLRNPLNVADGNIELAMEDSESEYLDIVSEAIAAMDVLIEDLLALAKEGATIDHRSQVSFEEVVETSSENIVMTDSTLEIRGRGLLNCDPSRVREALENLFRNAIEHSDTSVTITAGILDTRDGFYVEDDGPGIDPCDRNHVFERGYTNVTQGSGLGLAIVKNIIDAHGWDIDVCTSPTGGARFEITDVEFV
ncbi:sensor histidine kinase [Natrinema halophilum]|uniref:histidine kinase n=1 Tax=Natrinema halophilum TaxID=1699371 RepID=A0A7D5KK31_9EURY|nr:PAS domain-containing sensor histidine kinase [Natrinema halophilum]QLG48678.1 PAS domain-containing sensor histidine kinase [Natrinema halophilum]